MEQCVEARDESSLLIDSRKTGQEDLYICIYIYTYTTLCLLTRAGKDLYVQNCCFL